MAGIMTNATTMIFEPFFCERYFKPGERRLNAKGYRDENGDTYERVLR